MPYFHFCQSCRERLYSTSRMTIDQRCPQCGGRLMPYHLVRGPGPTRRRRGRSYASLADFYNGDRRRLASPERDVGLWWRDADGEPLHRAAWVEDTGELYIVRADDGEDGGGRVEVLARSRDWTRLARSLTGWRDVCGERDSLAWLRRQLGGLGPPAGGAAASA
jgi:predicted  nucleic acid-binding Zn-ribbon protein